ncbi:flavin-containing monooxygenase [Allorhizocola rhizosphaerae]|uniref:flavin-containing monooxygenase n=1 Tax=Allorhizocola rhizosphaerae TaxID=1872709 RepID=UPI000E3CBC9B|nr:NAD(P)/FAD-dependent oxidoreductase [Allorhizocola rhizosphaerae]
MLDTPHDLLVIGGGQAGLATAFHATRKGWRTVIAEASGAASGSWPRFYESLTLFSPARRSSLPGMPFPGDDGGRYPHRDEVVAYLAGYAARLDADIRLNTPVSAVARHDNAFSATTPHGVLRAWRVVSATGGFASPHRPALPGLETFPGTVLHSAEYRAPQAFSGQHVVVVGAGNSAVQIATELAGIARVTLTSRHPIRFIPQRPFGRDIHDWLAWTRLDHGRPSAILKPRNGVAALDDGRHRAGLTSGNPLWRPMFDRIDGHHVLWADGAKDTADAILLATGFRPDLAHLRPLIGDCGPVHRSGVSTTVPGLGFVGLEWQRGFASATLRGVGPDAAYLLRHPRMTGVASAP